MGILSSSAEMPLCNCISYRFIKAMRPNGKYYRAFLMCKFEENLMSKYRITKLGRINFPLIFTLKSCMMSDRFAF